SQRCGNPYVCCDHPLLPHVDRAWGSGQEHTSRPTPTTCILRLRAADAGVDVQCGCHSTVGADVDVVDIRLAGDAVVVDVLEGLSEHHHVVGAHEAGVPDHTEIELAAVEE